LISLVVACGPYFEETALAASVVLFVVIKPLAYFGFIQAFRYRVSRPIPMRFRQALFLTFLRTALGIAAVGLGAWTVSRSQQPAMIAAGWIFLYVERVASWWFVGWWGAGLQGRRLVGWVLSGTMINATFDGAVLLGLMHGWQPMAMLSAGVALFIIVLHIIGRRDSLRTRFSNSARCRDCGYDLTGNVSGRCPECGITVVASASSATV
jgi:hypothetical protein